MYNQIKPMLREFMSEVLFELSAGNLFVDMNEPREISNVPQEGFFPYYDGGYTGTHSKTLLYLSQRGLHNLTGGPMAVAFARQKLADAEHSAAECGKPGSPEFDECYDEYLESVTYDTIINILYCKPCGNHPEFHRNRTGDLHPDRHRIAVFAYGEYTTDNAADIAPYNWFVFDSPGELKAALPALKRWLIMVLKLSDHGTKTVQSK